MVSNTLLAFCEFTRSVSVLAISELKCCGYTGGKRDRETAIERDTDRGYRQRDRQRESQREKKQRDIR